MTERMTWFADDLFDAIKRTNKIMPKLCRRAKIGLFLILLHKAKDIITNLKCFPFTGKFSGV